MGDKARHRLAKAARFAARGEASGVNGECANAETRLAMGAGRVYDQRALSLPKGDIGLRTSP